MFEITEIFLIQLIHTMPFLIPFILVMNLISHLLWGDK